MSSDKDLITSAVRRLADSAEVMLDPPQSLRQLQGGRNSRVYMVVGSGGSKYVAKRYFRHKNDSRDRLATEFQSLRYMWRHGLTCIPRPLAADAENNLAFYEYVPGTIPKSAEISLADIDLLIDFLYQLNQMKDKQGSRNLMPASEACFSFEMALENLALRLKRLEAVEDQGPQHLMMKQLLAQDIRPLLSDAKEWLKRELPSSGLALDVEIPWTERTLSPSDYGFHNALRQSNGGLVFLDFEYFGWDDPAKMILDFLLHPAVELSEALKRHFLQRMLELFDPTGGLAQRIGYFQVLFGLKWALILLNEFHTADFSRRRFAGERKTDRAEVLARQLEKVRGQLEWIRGVYGKTDPAF